MPKKINKPQLTIGGEKITGVKQHQLNIDIPTEETDPEVIKLMNYVSFVIKNAYPRLGYNISICNGRVIETANIKVMCFLECQGILRGITISFSCFELNAVCESANLIGARIREAIAKFIEDIILKLEDKEDATNPSNT